MFDSAIPLLQFFLSVLYQHLYLESCANAYGLEKKSFACNKWKLLSKNSFWDPAKQSQTGARGGKKCSPVKIENVVPYTWLLVLLHLRACWILDNADPGYCRGATDFSWQSIHTLARDHRECGGQYPVTSMGYLHSCSSLGPYFRVEWKDGTVF